MELIVISDAKLKVMLTAEELKKYELDAEGMDSESTEAKRVLRGILDEVKRRTGFDAGGERILVQLYPSRTGGCELFVTKLGRFARNGEPARNATVAMYDLRSCCFAFSSLDCLLRVCRQLLASGYALFSAAYAGEDGRYYLVLQEHLTRQGSPGRLAFVEEYGVRRRGGTELAYIKEHGICIADADAVARLAAFA